MTKFNPAHPVPCVYLKHGAYWLVKRGKWTRIGTTLAEALSEYGRLESAPRGGMPALIAKVYAHHAPKLAKSTRDQYAQAADILARKLAQFAPDEVRGKHVAAIKVSMSDTPNMANRALSFLRTVFSYAVEWQLIDSNPCTGVKRFPEAKRKRYITDAEWWAVHAAAGPRLRAIMRLQYLTASMTCWEFVAASWPTRASSSHSKRPAPAWLFGGRPICARQSPRRSRCTAACLR